MPELAELNRGVGCVNVHYLMDLDFLFAVNIRFFLVDVINMAYN